MAMSTSSGGGVKAEPNVTPMIDVMLVLLIIFMVVTPALLACFNAQPPVGQNLKDHPEDEEMDQVLGIDRDGNYYLNKRPISKDAIEKEIKRIYDARQVDKIMYLKADKDLALFYFVAFFHANPLHASCNFGVHADLVVGDDVAGCGKNDAAYIAVFR